MAAEFDSVLFDFDGVIVDSEPPTGVAGVKFSPPTESI